MFVLAVVGPRGVVSEPANIETASNSLLAENELLRWLVAEAKPEDAPKFRPVEMGTLGRSVVATEALAKGAVVYLPPSQLRLTAAVVLPEILGQEPLSLATGASLRGILELAAAVLLARRNGKPGDSTWSAWNATFPSEEDLLSVTEWPSQVPEGVLLEFHLLRTDLLEHAKSLHDALQPRFPGITLAEALWALQFVDSRAFRCGGIADERPPPVILPLVDLLNHFAGSGMTGPNVGVRQDCAVVALVPIGEGDVLVKDYGERSCVQWLLQYGFLPPGAEKAEKPQISLGRTLPSSAPAWLRSEAEACGCEQQLLSMTHPLPPKVVCCARVAKFADAPPPRRKNAQVRQTAFEEGVILTELQNMLEELAAGLGAGAEWAPKLSRGLGDEGQAGRFAAWEASVRRCSGIQIDVLTKAAAAAAELLAVEIDLLTKDDSFDVDKARAEL